jgi:hypothetical protein
MTYEDMKLNETIILRRGVRYGTKPRNRARLVAVGILATTAFCTAAATSTNRVGKLTAHQLPSITKNVNRLMPLAGIEVMKPKRIRFALDEKDGVTFKSLNSYYVGKARVEIDWNDVDLTQNLRYMWARKQKTFPVTPAVVKSVAKIIDNYEHTSHETTTLKAYVKRADFVVNDARSHLDFPGLCAKFKLDSDRCVRLQYLSGRITGRSLVAYGMTELFPSRDGETNKAMLDVMLRRAGVDYIDAIPALGDKYLSMGFYQFTSFAVRHDASGREGANVVAEFGQSLPGSVMQLHGDDQHRAAYYFATYNLMRMVRNLSPRQYANLKAKSPISEANLTTFMAAAHHLPGGARKAAAAWLQEGCTLPLRDYLRGDLVVYGAKSATNLKALS